MSFRQRLAVWLLGRAQAHGRHTVRVLGREYRVSPEVLNPKYCLTSEFMARNIRVRPEDVVLDLGTGSGIQAITAGQTARRVVAVDINPHAVCCARANVEANGMAGTVSVLEGDLFGPLPAVPQFDVILFTPPFLDGGVRTPFDHALFDHRQSLVRRMFVQARTYLRSGGYVQMLYSTIAHANRVVAMTSELGWECHTLARQKRLMETFVIWRLTPRPDPARLVPFPSTSVCNNTADAG